MIKTEWGRTQLKGGKEIILTDVSTIIEATNDFLIKEVGMDEENAKEAIQYAYDLAFESDEEVVLQNEKMKEELGGMCGSLAELLETLAANLKGGASK